MSARTRRAETRGVIEDFLIDLSNTLGAWTYLLVAGLAFLETGAFVGLIAPGETAGLWARIQATLSRIVMVRRVADTAGGGVDAVLARAERQLNDGDVDHALRTLEGLSPAAREAIDPWLVRARNRAEIDRRVSAVRAQALEDLARISRGGA